MSRNTYDGEGVASLLRHIVGVVGSYERHGIQEGYITCVLFTYTLRGHPLLWCDTLPEKYIHSLTHLVAEIDRAFNHFNYKELNQEILEL